MQHGTSGVVESERRPAAFQYRGEGAALQSPFQQQLFRSSAVRVWQSRFEESMRLFSPIKIVASVQSPAPGGSSGGGGAADLAGMAHQVLRYFRYHFGSEKVLCASASASAGVGGVTEIETSVLLSVEDLQPWTVREADMLSRNLNLDRQTAGVVVRVRPVDTSAPETGRGGSEWAGSSLGCALALTVPQQWEREIESVPVGAMLPLGSIWWRVLGGFEHPNILETRILNIYMGGHLSTVQPLYSTQMNFISAASVLLVEVASPQDAASLASLFDGRILQGLGKGPDKHLFSLRAASLESIPAFLRKVKLPTWALSPVSRLLAVPPLIPAHLFDVYNRQLPPVLTHNPEDEDVTLLPAERWAAGRASWRAERFRANVGEEVAARICRPQHPNNAPLPQLAK